MLRKLTTNETKQWINEFYKEFIMNKTKHEQILYFINGNKFFEWKKDLYELLDDKDYDGLINYTEDYIKYFNLCKKNFKLKKIKFFYFLTVTGKNRIIVNDDNIAKMKNCLKLIFNNDNYKRYYKVLYNIETGKYEDNPNLHTHAVIIFDSTNKNFKRDFTRTWNRFFKSDGIDFKMDSFSYLPCYDIYEDKCNYLKNVDKSVEHQNYLDLKILEHVE
jgi:hypothetical protein